MNPPLIVGLGGSTRPTSLTELLLRHTLDLCAAAGAVTRVFDGAFLAALPTFDADVPAPTAAELLDAVSQADGVILASPGYHGGLSGLVKNGIDHLEALRDAPRPYLDGRPIGTIVTAAGWQACGTALVSLRSTVHALRGWPTPFGAMVNSAEPMSDETGELNARIVGALAIVAQQVMEFVAWRAPTMTATGAE